MNSVVSTKLLDNNSPRDFTESLGKVIYVNKMHVSPTDWGWISPADADSAWKKVPREDTEYLGQIVREGCSFAYASLLQVCDRNNIDWIHFSNEHRKIRGLTVFDDAWRQPDFEGDTSKTGSKQTDRQRY